MRRLVLSVVCVGAFASVASAQSTTRLPAAFYDIELRGSMLDGASSRMGAGGINRPVAAPPRGNGIGGGIIVRENSGVSRFIITADSLLFRNGQDLLEIAASDFISVNEVHGSRTPHIAWVHLRYRHADEERDLYVRRYTVREQGALREAFEAALALRQAPDTRPH